MAPDDRALLAGAMGCDERQREELLRLDPGQAVVRGGDLHEAVRIQVPGAGTAQSPVDDTLVRKAWRRFSPASPSSTSLRTSALERRIEGPAFLRRLDRLFLQLVDGSESFTESLGQLEADLRQLPAWSGDASALVVAGLTRVGERQLEHRARTHGWSLTDTDDRVREWEALVQAFARRGREGLAARRGGILAAAQTLGKSLAAALDVASGPFAACVVCERRCRYRHEVSRNLSAPMVARVRRAVAAGDAPGVAKEILAATWELIGGGDRDLSESVATCFAVSLSHRLVEGHRRVSLARALSEDLKEEIWS
jgi:hypothetical protein